MAGKGFVGKSLMDREDVVHTSKLHWIIFLPPIFFLAVTIALIPTAAALEIDRETDDGKIWFGLLVVLLITAALKCVDTLIEYKTSEFAVTTRRVLIKTGFIRRHVSETLLLKVEGIKVDQSILGRLFGYGTLSVIGTGGTRDSFAKIKEPFQFRQAVQEQVEQTHTQPNTAPLPPMPPSTNQQ